MKVVTYARGSSHSVDEQQQQLLNALPPEFEVAGSYADIDLGWDTDLPEFVTAWKRLAGGEVQALCVQSLDRLARRGGELEAVQRWCSENGFVIQEIPELPERQ